MRHLNELHDIAQSRLGIVTTQDLRQIGISRGAQSRLLRAGAMSVVYPGVLRVTGYGFGHLQQSLAAHLWGGPETYLSHVAGAISRGAPLTPRDQIELIVPRGFTRRCPGIITHQPRNRMDIRPSLVDGIPVCSPLRLLLDLGATASTAEVSIVMEHFLIAGATTITAITNARERHRVHGRTGVAALDAVLREVRFGTKPPDSALEPAFDRIMQRFGLPAPMFHLPITVGGGTLTPDFTWPIHRLIVEVDGWAYHSSRAQTEEDRERDLLLTAAGYTVVRVTWLKIVRRPALVAGNLHLALQHRAAA